MSSLPRIRRVVVAAALGATSFVAVSAVGSSAAPPAAVTLPADNLLSNPSFEAGTAGWTPNGLTRTTLAGSLAAPDGSYVADLVPFQTGGSGPYYVRTDNWPGETTSTTVGVTYSGAVWVAAANAASVGKTATLVVREHDASGTAVAQWSSQSTTLSASKFKMLKAGGAAIAAGDYIDIYVAMDSPTTASAMYADAFSLQASYPMPTTNSVPDESFENGGTWTAGADSSVTRPVSTNAPDGDRVGDVSWTGSGSTASIAAALAPISRKSQGYQATALVSAATAAAVGTNVTLTITEVEAGGGLRASASSSPFALTANFHAITTTLTAAAGDDKFTVTISAAPASAGDILQVDATTFAATTAALGELALDYDQMTMTALGDATNNLGDTSRYRYVVVQLGQRGHHHDPNDPNVENLVDKIHDANPATVVLAYEETASVCEPGATECDTGHASCAGLDDEQMTPYSAYGVGYCWMNANHGSGADNWFLHDSTSGDPLEFTNYAGRIMADIGNPGYQDEWASNVISAVRAEGFDGVYLDDVNTYPSHGANGKIAEYPPTQTTEPYLDQGDYDNRYGAAMTSFVTSVGAQLRAAGLVTMANMGVNLDDPVDWQVADGLTMSGDLDTVSKEFYTHYTSNEGQPTSPDGHTCVSPTYSSPFDADQLGWIRGFDQSIQSQGGKFAGLDYNGAGGVTRMSYGRAAFYLAWNGRPRSAYFNRSCGDVDPANAAWTVNLGLPAQIGLTTTSTGLLTRDYVRGTTAGLVVLNPTSAALPYALDGAWVDPQGAAVSGTVSVGAHSALLLRKTG